MSKTSTPSISVSCTAISSTLLQKAKELARKLQLHFVDFNDFNGDYHLNLDEDGLSLHQRSKRSQVKPLRIDFNTGASAYRHRNDRGIKQPIARAVGIKPGFRPAVFDATAGLGDDSFVFATLGCKVTMCERSPVLWSLLEDGLVRAANTAGTIGETAKRMTLLLGDSSTLLESLPEKPYTVYFDPMYPHSAKSALNKKEMRIIRELVGNDEDAATTLESLLSHAENRVVVKRPKAAPMVGSRSPSHTINMKNSRFDVYLTTHL